MTQQSLVPIASVDPAEVEAEDVRIARMNAYDDWQAAYLARFYAARRAAILASGDAVRIRLLHERDARLAMMEAAA